MGEITSSSFHMTVDYDEIAFKNLDNDGCSSGFPACKLGAEPAD